jgi:hypothetical protein
MTDSVHRPGYGRTIARTKGSVSGYETREKKRYEREPL